MNMPETLNEIKMLKITCAVQLFSENITSKLIFAYWFTKNDFEKNTRGRHNASNLRKNEYI